ncbi:MAG: DUF3667 domain-containing protein [bacterium]
MRSATDAGIPGDSGGDEGRCPNCGSGPIDAYCAACGERQPSHADYSARAVALEVASEFLSVDGRLWRSVVTLLTKPGLLTREYFSGRRGRYMRPFSLFILLNVAFFFVQPYTGLLRYTYASYVGSDGLQQMAEEKRNELGLDPTRFAERFEDTLQEQKKSLLLVAIPVFALTLMLLYLGSGRVYVEHLVFSVHAYAFTVFYLTAMGTVWFGIASLLYREVPALRPAIQAMGSERGVVLILGTGMLTYLSVALRTFYGTRALPALGRAALLFGMQAALIVFFRHLLFHTTIAAL